MGNSRQRIVEASAEFFRQQGYAGTGIKQILEAANAPFGSLYHHFPGGKEELGVEVIRHSGQLYQRLFETIYDAQPDAAAGIAAFFFGAAEALRQSGYADACPVGTIALEVAGTSEPLRQATAEVFESWIGAVGGRLQGAGIARAAARKLAILIVGSLEGAFMLCRSLRDAEAMELAGQAMAAAVQAALPNGKFSAKKSKRRV